MSLHHLCVVRSMHEWHMLFEAFPIRNHRDRLFPVECRMAHATGFAYIGTCITSETKYISCFCDSPPPPEAPPPVAPLPEGLSCGGLTSSISSLHDPV